MKTVSNTISQTGNQSHYTHKYVSVFRMIHLACLVIGSEKTCAMNICRAADLGKPRVIYQESLDDASGEQRLSGNSQNSA
jgi:hypothetical protein